MPKKGERKARAPLGDLADAHGFAALLADYLAWLGTRNYAEATLRNRAHYVGEFIKWCAERSLVRPAEITKPILERYQRWLFQYRKDNGQPLSFPSQIQHLLPVRAFFKWLCRHNLLLSNPASDLELPRGEKRLPKHILNAAEAERVLGAPPLADPLGLRDRAILEVFYSTGMRRMELLGLKLHDLDAERGTVMIRQGKGKKDRMIPMGERAFAWVRRYVEEARPSLSLTPDDGTVFLTNLGTPFEPGRLTQLVRDYIDAAETGKRGACHLFRHTMATLMLENGADIRFIQQQLGHAELSTTQIYTQVSIRMLKEVHTRTHPAATLSPEARAEIDAELAAEAEEEADDGAE
ncbi:MAG: site-specific tyrosine recombinase XerC [Opitutaceae bacterium]